MSHPDRSDVLYVYVLGREHFISWPQFSAAGLAHVFKESSVEGTHVAKRHVANRLAIETTQEHILYLEVPIWSFQTLLEHTSCKSSRSFRWSYLPQVLYLESISGGEKSCRESRLLESKRHTLLRRKASPPSDYRGPQLLSRKQHRPKQHMYETL